MFHEMLARHGRAFAFQPEEIGYVDLKIVAPMMIFTVPHIPWNFKPTSVPRARIPQLIELLKENIRMRTWNLRMHHIQIGGSPFQRRMGH
jgi:hypothetical protein